MVPLGERRMRVPRHSTVLPARPQTQIAQHAPAYRDAGEHADGERRYAYRPGARGDGDQRPERRVRDQVAIISARPRHTDTARPTQLVAPDFAPAFPTQMCFDDGWGKGYAQSEGVDVETELVIVGQVPADGCEAADAAQIRGTQQHSGTEGEFHGAEHARH